MKRFIIEGQKKDGTWINLFKNQRSYKSKRGATCVYNFKKDEVEVSLRISEVEIETELEKLKRLIIEARTWIGPDSIRHYEKMQKWLEETKDIKVEE